MVSKALSPIAIAATATRVLRAERCRRRACSAPIPSPTAATAASKRIVVTTFIGPGAAIRVAFKPNRTDDRYRVTPSEPAACCRAVAERVLPGKRRRKR